MKCIGIISDTHSHWDERYLKHFEQCDEIWHAGDICDMATIERLEQPFGMNDDGTPAMDGTASRGSSTQYARADHVHPTDTSRAAASDLAAKADKVTEVTVSTAGAVTQALDAGKIYHFTGALTALTITLNAPASGDLAQYHFDFLSGSTAPTLTMPNTVTMPDSFAVEASKRYEVDVLNNYGAVVSWAT